MLCYPVITMGNFAHQVSKIRLIKKTNKKMEDMLSIENNIDASFPKTFIWHCIKDPVVDYHNSTMLSDSLNKMGVLNKFKLIDDKYHDLGLASKCKTKGWLERAIDFWNKNN